MRLTVRCSRAALCVDRLSQAALAASLQDARAAGLAFGVDAAELEQKLDEAEEADLKMAMALSMQLEEERERMAIEGREIPLQLAPIDSCQPAGHAAATTVAIVMSMLNAPFGRCGSTVVVGQK